MRKSLIAIMILFSTVLLYAGIDEDLAWITEANPSARAKALGEAGVAVNDMSSSLYINSAVMAFEPHGRLSGFYGHLPDSAHFAYMEYVYPFSASGSIGAAIETSIKDNANHIQKYSFGLSVSIIKGLAIGVAGKSIMKSVDLSTATDGDYAENFGVEAGLHLAPFKWFNIGARIENINAPTFEYTEAGVTEELPMNVQSGINLFYTDYFNIMLDVYSVDLNEKFGKTDHQLLYGVEVFPDPALAVRAGSHDDKLRLGLGIVSKNMEFDYALETEYEQLVNFIQVTYKFGLSPTRKEAELSKREKEITRDSIYYEGLIYLNMGEVAVAKSKVTEYRNKFGDDKKIQRLDRDIERWLNKERKERFGKAEEIKKDILRDFYKGNLDQAVIQLDNMKLIAPNYEGVAYLEHILNAGLLLEEGKYLEAEENLVNALKIDPDSKEVKDLYNRLQEVINLSEEEK